MPTKYLDHPETIAAYLTEALATDDPEFICLALDTIAKAKGMTKVARGYRSFAGKLVQIVERHDKA